MAEAAAQTESVLPHVDRHGHWCGVPFGSDPSFSYTEVSILYGACFLLPPYCTIVLYTGGARKSALLVREQHKRLAFPRVSLLLLRQL